MAAEGDQISVPELPSATAEQDLPAQPPSTEDAGEVEFQPPTVQDSSPGPEGGSEDAEELKGAQDTEELKEAQDAAEEGEREQPQEEEKEDDEEEGDKEENPESFREAKRRKTSPAALKKPEEPKPCSRTERGGVDEAIGFGGGFSFSFDVRGVTSPIETTPRFGSMVSKYSPADLVAAAAEIGGGRGTEEEVTGKAATKATTLAD